MGITISPKGQKLITERDAPPTLQLILNPLIYSLTILTFATALFI